MQTTRTLQDMGDTTHASPDGNVATEHLQISYGKDWEDSMFHHISFKEMARATKIIVHSHGRRQDFFQGGGLKKISSNVSSNPSARAM